MAGLGYVFRGVFPAASLKPPEFQRPAMYRVSFPRGIPRGLIEASQIGLSAGGQLIVFRGVFPAASLKPEAPPATGGDPSLYSAGYSPRPH